MINLPCLYLKVSQLIYPSFHDSTMPHLKDGLLFTSVVFHNAVFLLLLTQGCAGNIHTNTTCIA